MSHRSRALQFGVTVSIAILAVAARAQTLTITNDLQLWLRADAGVTTNASGGVTQWTDQTTNGNTAVQAANLATPLLIPAALNNRPVLRFDGVDDFLDVTDSESLSGAGDLTSFFVVRFNDFDGFNAVWAKTAANLPAPTDIYTVPGSGFLRIYRGDGSATNLSSVDTALPLRANSPLVVAFDVNGGTLSHYLNNQANGTGAVTTVTADGNTPLKIGTRGDNFTRLDGDIAELLIYSRALSALERSNVFNYLQTKYNLLNLTPNIALSTVPAGPAVGVGDLVTLNATATDLDGTIARVDFFGNGALIGAATAPPYSLRVRVESAGAVQFTARATDDKGGIANSAPVTLAAAGSAPGELAITNGLQLWLRADAGATVGLGATGVVQWADQSGAGNHALQVDENLGPALVNDAVNGRAALRFDGVNDFLEVADSESLSITGDITTMFVLRFADFATFRAVWGKTAANQPAPTDIYANSGTGRLRFFRGNGTMNGSSEATQPFAANTFLLGGVEMAGSAVRHYYNGVPNGSGNITAPIADANGTLRVGTRGDGVTRMKGDMAELVIFNRVLSLSERRTVERYLTEKYGLPGLIAVTNAAPEIALSATDGSVVSAPGSATIEASVSDPDGSVVSVQFLVDGVPVGTDTAAPFTTNISLTYGGGVMVSAIVTDNFGGRTTTVLPLCVQGPGRPAGLMGYWPLDGNANALFGAGGILVSNPAPTLDRNGIADGALFFDGALQQRVQIPGGGGLNGTLRGSISLWVKWIGTQDTGFGGAAGAVLSRQQDGSFSDTIINLNNADPNAASIHWRQNSAGGINLTSGVVVLSDTWRHIVVTFTETNSEMFVDGFLEASGPGGLLHVNAATALNIGAWPGGGGSFATAAIDDVAVWNRVLSFDEVQLLAGQVRTPLDLLIAPDCLTASRDATTLSVTWGSDAVLETATSITGPWQEIISPSPYTVPVIEIEDDNVFFRLRSR